VSGQPANATNRLYYVRLPANYDPNKPYRTVYLGKGCGPAQDNDPTMRQVYALETASTDQAILIEMEPGLYNEAEYNSTCQPPASGVNTCHYCFDDWASKTTIESTEPIEHAYFAALHAAVETSFCVDKKREFFAGYSSGGWLAQQLGCWFPDVLRAQGNVTGGLPPPIKSNVAGANDYCVKHPIAAMLIHDYYDGMGASGGNPYVGSVDAASRLFKLNGCTGTFAAPDPNSTASYTITGYPNSATFKCVQYPTCPVDYPFVFCVSTNQMHNAQTSAAVPGFWQFFSKL
jgi:hypothetical protein